MELKYSRKIKQIQEQQQKMDMLLQDLCSMLLLITETILNTVYTVVKTDIHHVTMTRVSNPCTSQAISWKIHMYP
jgi:hypothetical protein